MLVQLIQNNIGIGILTKLKDVYKRQDLGFSIRSLEIGSSLSMSELLKLASFLDNVSRIKTYGKKEREDLPNEMCIRDSMYILPIRLA